MWDGASVIFTSSCMGLFLGDVVGKQIKKSTITWSQIQLVPTAMAPVWNIYTALLMAGRKLPCGGYIYVHLTCFWRNFSPRGE